MALTDRRALFLAGTACGLIAAAYLPPAPVERPTFYGDVEMIPINPVRSNRSTVRELLTANNERLIRMELADSLMRLPAVRAAQAGGPTVVFDRRNVTDRTQQFLVADARDQWLALGPVRGEVRWVLAVFLDTANRAHGESRQRPPAPAVRWALPAATDGRTCLTMLTVAPPASARAAQTGGWRWQVADGELLGPCAFYAAFGVPGPQVASWLMRSGFAPATTVDFTTQTMPGAMTDLFGEPLPRWQQAMLPIFAGAWAMPLPGLFPCVAGDAEPCERAVLGQSAPPTPYRIAMGIGSPIVRAATVYGGDRAERRMLSDLVHEGGHAAFGRFWTSPAPVDSAFRAAYGESLGHWASRWAGQAYRGVMMSSRLTAGDWISVAIAVALGLAAAVALSFRRQVS